MTKIRLKYAVPEIGGTLYAVDLHCSRQEEPVIPIHRHRSQTYHGEASEASKTQRQRFKEAVAYAKAAIADPDTRAIYKRRAAVENMPPYQLAVSDYMHGKDLHIR